MARFDLYGHVISGPNYRVALMLRLCAEPFRYHHVDLRSGVHKSSDYIATKNRYGQVPALHDTERNLYIVQSAAILEYLADTLGKLNGDSEAERLEAREWCYWETDVMERILRLRGYTIGYITAPPDVVTHYRDEGLAALGALDSMIAGRDWVCGGNSPTFADVYIYGSVGLAHEADLDIQTFENVARWAKAFQELEGFGRPKDLCCRVQ